MKRDAREAKFGGAVRGVDATGHVNAHPHYRRLYVYSVPPGEVLELRTPRAGWGSLRAGMTVGVCNRGIGGTGVIRFVRSDGLVWDFATHRWTASVSSACDIGPGFIGWATFEGWVNPLVDDDENQGGAPSPGTVDDIPFWHCRRKTAAPAEMLAGGSA